MKSYTRLADMISNPIFFIASDGTLIHLNESAMTLLKISKAENYKNIFDLIPDLKSGEENGFEIKDVALGNFRLSVCTQAFTSEDGCQYKVLLFEDTPISSKLLSQILEAVDEGLTVIDASGTLEICNQTSRELLGVKPTSEKPFTCNGQALNSDSKYFAVGENLGQMLKENNYLHTPLYPTAIKEKITVRKNMKYVNGVNMTYTDTPVLDEEQNVKHVVLTGRDVSRMVQLENQLYELEKIKNDYYSQLMKLVKNRDGKDPVCSSKKMEHILGLSSKVALTDAPIFLTGESGVGKEEVARYIHRCSTRADKPFIAINCSAVPEHLIESELFGYAPGSFTGANKGGKKGLLEEANGGTFFLDEIGELPFPVQSKLLRVFQENQLYRIGATAPVNIDVRYISATNLSESELKNSAKFRRDLYYRICVVPIHIPPLRERTDDIVPLISHFLEYFNQKYNKKIRLSNIVLRRMTRLDWPGNAREIKNVVERLVILGDDGVIDEEQLQYALDMDGGGQVEKISVKGVMPLAEAHNLLDKILIEEAYAQHGTIVEAAKALGTYPSTIHRKIKAGQVKLKT
ncbi:MAG: sigma 54-interacting transcriptional regulator [Oscillospiraceae bacterium]